MNNIKIAIDGPAASGKSTIAKLIAEQLNFTHIDSGSMYRAVTLKALALDLDLEYESNFEFVKSTKIRIY